MNITLSGTKVSMDGHTLAFQKNNLVDSMVITVDTDETWQYKLDVKYPCKDSNGKELYNVIDLTRVGNTCTAILQATMLPFNGKYTMQFRGVSGDKVYHTDTFDVWVKYSIDPSKVYDPVPSEFYQIEQAVTEQAANAKQSATESAESATKAENAAVHSPIVGENGNWFVWDFEKSEYVDSGKPASTPPITTDTAGMYLTNDGSKAEWGEVNGTLRVNLNKNSNDEWIIDKTFEEIQNAINDGQVVYVVDTFNEPTTSGDPGYRTFYYDSYSSPRFGGNFYTFVSSSYGEIRALNIYFNRVYVYDIGVNAVLGEEVSSNNVLKMGDHGINAAIPDVDYALPTLYVTITQDGQDSDGNPIYKSDKTYKEINVAWRSGQKVEIAHDGIFYEIPLNYFGVQEIPLISVDSHAYFAARGVPKANTYNTQPYMVGGQPIATVEVLIKYTDEVRVVLPVNLSTGKWIDVNKLPQQYVIDVTAGTDGTLKANWTYDKIQETMGAYQTDIGGTAVFGVTFEGCLYRMVAGDNKSVVFSNTTPEGISTLTLSQKDGKDVWTHEVVSLTSGYTFCPYLFLNEDNTGGYYLSDKDGNEVLPRVVSNQYGSIQYIYYQRFKYTISFTGDGTPYIDFLAVNGDEYAIISVDIAASYGRGTVTWSGWKPICPNQTPEVTTADNGKFLRVVDGQWAAEAAGGEMWEKIAEIVIPEGADELTALTINKDSDGNPFSLVKARLCAKFPKYTGATTIPNYSFAMLNGKIAGRVTPLAYTSVWPKVSASIITGTVYEIDVSGAQQIEHVIRSENVGWPDDSSRDYVVYGTTSDTDATWFGDTLWAKPITSIGGTNMLIYPGCRFELYGVRA